MLMLYAAVIDDAEDIKKFEKIYYEYREQMFFVANKILRDSYEAEDAAVQQRTAGDSAQHKETSCRMTTLALCARIRSQRQKMRR